MPATFDDVAKAALALDEVTEGVRHGTRTWFVDGKAFAWERGFSKKDVERFVDVEPPKGPFVAVRVADLADKEAVLAEHGPAVFTIPHFDGYTGVLIQLRKVRKAVLRELIFDAWLARAPRRLTEAHERP